MTDFWENPLFSHLFLGGYLIVLGLVWTVMVIGVQRWGRLWWVHPPQDDTPEQGSWLSICIPARNEAENIGDCVKAALAVHWPKFEVIVVDDRSTDKTGEIARNAAEGDERLRVVDGVAPRLGWAGKPWACRRAASEARGAWLLFIDADVQIHPDAARAAIAIASERELSLLSFFGTWNLHSFWERAVIPAVGWLIRGAIDFDKVNVRSCPEAFANGQFILMRRDSYASIDGHGAVRNQVLEDVRLAEVVKRAGYGVEVRPAPWAFQVRLYRSLFEIVNGYTKNMYEGMGRNPVIGLGAALFIFVGTLLPFIALFFALILQFGAFGGIHWLWLLALVLICALQIIFRVQIERFDQRSGWMAWTHPIANFVLFFILLRSTLRVQVTWKGRTFVDGRAEEESSILRPK